MKQCLLIADHDAKLCELYRMLLTESGYDVETSTDGLDGLATNKLRPPEGMRHATTTKQAQ